jgi:hypothetical protein
MKLNHKIVLVCHAFSFLFMVKISWPTLFFVMVKNLISYTHHKYLKLARVQIFVARGQTDLFFLSGICKNYLHYKHLSSKVHQQSTWWYKRVYENKTYHYFTKKENSSRCNKRSDTDACSYIQSVSFSHIITSVHMPVVCLVSVSMLCSYRMSPFTC